MGMKGKAGHSALAHCHAGRPNAAAGLGLGMRSSASQMRRQQETYGMPGFCKAAHALLGDGRAQTTLQTVAHACSDSLQGVPSANPAAGGARTPLAALPSACRCKATTGDADQLARAGV